MRPRYAILATSTLLVTSCSYVYDLQAIVLNGHITFVVDPRSKRQADCIRSIYVQTTQDETAQAKPGPNDAKDLVKNGVFWWKDYAVDQCLNKFPIRYGQPLVGKPFVYSDGDTKGVEAKPLVVGVVYQVETASAGSGYGWGRFRIRMDHTVENLPSIETTENDVMRNGS